MSELAKLPNIGKTIEQHLIEIGIDTPEKLKAIGSKEAWLKIKVIDHTACLNQLYALEGAIQGIRWHSLDTQTKEDLKEFFNMSI